MPEHTPERPSAHDHILRKYDEELVQLRRLVVEMGGLAEHQLARAVEALQRRDAALARQVVEGDQRLDEMEQDVDAHVIRIIALHGPVAEDLRTVIATLKIASNLERIGDLAKNIAKRTLSLVQVPAVGSAANALARMASIVQGMIQTVLDAFVSRDAERAQDVIRRDEEVDLIHTGLFRELLTYMIEDPRSITPCTHLLFMAKNIERMGDHATSIAEQTIFLVRGTLPEHDRPKSDEASFVVVDGSRKAGESEGQEGTQTS